MRPVRFHSALISCAYVAVNVAVDDHSRACVNVSTRRSAYERLPLVGKRGYSARATWRQIRGRPRPDDIAPQWRLEMVMDSREVGVKKDRTIMQVSGCVSAAVRARVLVGGAAR